VNSRTDSTIAEDAALFVLVSTGVCIVLGAVLGTYINEGGLLGPPTYVPLIAGSTGLVSGAVAVIRFHKGHLSPRSTGDTGRKGIWFDLLAFLGGTSVTIIGQTPLYYLGVNPPFRGFRYVHLLLPIAGGCAVLYLHKQCKSPLIGQLSGETWGRHETWVLFVSVGIALLFYLMRIFGSFVTVQNIVLSLIGAELIVRLRRYGIFVGNETVDQELGSQ
jgi:hypothetical protein